MTPLAINYAVRRATAQNQTIPMTTKTNAELADDLEALPYPNRFEAARRLRAMPDEVTKTHAYGVPIDPKERDKMVAEMTASDERAAACAREINGILMADEVMEAGVAAIIARHYAQPSDEVVRLKAALDKARNGLLWYKGEHPKDASPADDEMMMEIDAALNPPAKEAK